MAGMSVPIWEVRLLVHWYGRLDMRLGLVVPLGAIISLANAGSHWRRNLYAGVGSVRRRGDPDAVGRG